MSKKLVHVAYRTDELSDGVSCATIMEGKARAVFAHAGQWYVITGGCYGPHGTGGEFDACTAIPVEDFKGQTTDYNERNRYLFDISPAAAERIREAGRFYEGIVVSCKGRRYVLQAERECWVSMSSKHRRP